MRLTFLVVSTQPPRSQIRPAFCAYVSKLSPDTAYRTKFYSNV